MVLQKDEVTIQLDELDTRLDRLRALYEQYFVGIEKIEPHVQKKDVERRFQVLRKVQLRNTAARFRFNALQQKYTSYLTYWSRITRRIEEGTYKRDLARIQRKGPLRARGDDDVPEFELDPDEIESLDDFDDDHPTTPPPAMPAQPATAVTAGTSRPAESPKASVPARAEPALPVATTTPKPVPAASPERAGRNVEEFNLSFHDDEPTAPPTPAAATPTASPASPPKPAAPAGNVTARRAGLSVFGVAPGAKPATAKHPSPAAAKPAAAPVKPASPVTAPVTAKPEAPGPAKKQ